MQKQLHSGPPGYKTWKTRRNHVVFVCVVRNPIPDGLNWDPGAETSNDEGLTRASLGLTRPGSENYTGVPPAPLALLG